MKCVFQGDTVPDGFEEKIEFSKEMPYTIHIKRFEVEDVVPLHYAETIELLLCEELSGEVVIDAEHYELGSSQLFVIPPYTVHSTKILPCSGVMAVLKINLSEIGRYFGVEEYLEACGCRIGSLAHQCSGVQEAKQVIGRMIEKDGSLRECIPLVVDMFRIISDASEEPHIQPHGRLDAAGLQELLLWTNRNCTRAITLEEAARAAGYSKYYFCSRFKALTGITYLEYLTSVRMSRACLLLQKGEQVQTAAAAVGFLDVSYFIQTFKKAYGVTPYRYAERYQDRR